METRTLRILLSEDDEDDYGIARDLLRLVPCKGMDLEWVSTYDAALEAVDRRQHDLYLFDYRLGPDDGLELAREARNRGSLAPIILLTGLDDWETDVQAMKAGASDYLVKGRFDAKILERSIR